MKNLIITVTLLLSLWGCYHVPLSKPQGREVPQELIGHWKEMKGDSVVAVVTIMKSSNEELFAAWIAADGNRNNNAYYRLYPIKVHGVECMQAALLTINGPIYSVCQYSIQGDTMYVATWESSHTGIDEHTTSKELRKIFKKEFGRKDLFEKMNFVLVKDSL